MGRKDKISLATKYLSNRRYLNEVPVEGKKNSKFQFHLGNYDLYAAQIIRTGSCITLLSSPMTVTEESFWNTTHFEDLAKYVFWTFNKSFLLKLLDRVENESPAILARFQDLLLENPVPYREPVPSNADEELRFCYMKNRNLQKDAKFQLMYSLDEQNRKVFLNAVEKKIARSVLAPFIGEAVPPPPPSTHDVEKPKDGPILDFLKLVRPMNGSPEETLRFITNQTEQAGYKWPLFSPVQRLNNGKNPYGFNGAIAAMIYHFQQLGYIDKGHRFDDVFKAYLTYSQNGIGKLPTFLANYRQDNQYRKYLSNLKDLKINKLP